MAQRIAFAFVLTKNVNLPSFKVGQCEVEIVVKGAVDDRTHQKMRDAVSTLFQKTQKSVNEDIEQRNLRISRMGVNEKKAKKGQEIATGNKKIQDLLASFKQEAEQEFKEFVKREEELDQKVAEAQRRENWRLVSWTTNVIWTGYKMIADTVEMVTAPVSIPLALKSFIDALTDLKGLVEDWGKYYATLPDMRAKVRQGLTNLKSKSKLTKSDVETFGKDVDLLEDKLLLLEGKTKAVSAKISSTLAAAPKKDVNEEVIKKAEEALHKSLEQVADASAEIRSASAFLLRMKKNLGMAKANAKGDTTFTWATGWAGTAYKTINDLKDFVLKPDEWVTWLDGAIKLVIAKGNSALGV